MHENFDRLKQTNTGLTKFQVWQSYTGNWFSLCLLKKYIDPWMQHVETVSSSHSDDNVTKLHVTCNWVITMSSWHLVPGVTPWTILTWRPSYPGHQPMFLVAINSHWYCDIVPKTMSNVSIYTYCIQFKEIQLIDDSY